MKSQMMKLISIITIVFIQIGYLQSQSKERFQELQKFPYDRSYMRNINKNIEVINISGDAHFEKDYLIINLKINNRTKNAIFISMPQWIFSSDSTGDAITYALAETCPVSRMVIFRKKYKDATSYTHPEIQQLYEFMPKLGGVLQCDTLTIKLKKKFSKEKYLSNKYKYHILVILYYAKYSSLMEYFFYNNNPDHDFDYITDKNPKTLQVNIEDDIGKYDGAWFEDKENFTDIKLTEEQAKVLKILFMNSAWGFIDIK